MPDKLISTSSSSYNELTNSSKRVLLDTPVDCVNLKKIKLFNNSNEKQVISLNTKKNKKNNLRIKKTPDQISKTTKNNSKGHSNVSKMRINSNSEKNNSNYDQDSNICKKVQNIGVDNLKTNRGKNVDAQDDFISEDESTDSNSSFKSFDLEFKKTDNYESVQNNSNINENKSLLGNLVTVEKSYHAKEDINKNSLLKKIFSHNHNVDKVVKGIGNNLINNSIDIGTTEKDNTSDIEDNAKTDHILKCCKEITKANFPLFVKIFSKKNVELEHFEATCSKIISLYMAKQIKEKIEVKMNEMLDIKKYWHNKYISLSQQIKDLTAFKQLPKEKLKIDSNAKPHQIKRSIGIQVDMYKTDQKLRLCVSKVHKPSQKPQNTLINNIVNLANDGGNVNETTNANDTNNDVNDNGAGCTTINNNVDHIVDNNCIVISDDDDDNENIVTLNTQPSTLNTMENITSKKQLPESNTTEESSDFLGTTVSNFENLPEISLNSINRYSNIIDLTEDDDDDSNNGNSAVLQNRTAIDQNLYTQSLTPSGQPISFTRKLVNVQLPPNNSGQHQLQSSGALQNVPMNFMKVITPAHGTKKFVQIRALPNGPQQFLELSAPPGDPQQYMIPNVPPNGPRQYVMVNASPNGLQQLLELSAPPSGPQQSVMPNAPPSGFQQYVMPNAPPSGPRKYVKPNAPPSGSWQYVKPNASSSGPRQYVKPNAPPSGSQQYVMPNAPPSGFQQYVMPNAPPSGPRKYVMPNAPPSGPRKYVKPNAPPSGSQQYVMPNAPPSGPRKNVKPNARQTGPSRRSNVSQICQPNTSAAIVQVPPVSQTRRTLQPSRPITNKHPAPLPITKNRRSYSSWKKLPSAPIMQFPFNVVAEGFVIKWDVNMCADTAKILSYQFYMYDEARSPPEPTSETWVEIGKIKALPLPMACSFSLLKPSRYYLSMRSIDVYGRFSPFCTPKPLIFY